MSGGAFSELMRLERSRLQGSSDLRQTTRARAGGARVRRIRKQQTMEKRRLTGARLPWGRSPGPGIEAPQPKAGGQVPGQRFYSGPRLFSGLELSRGLQLFQGSQLSWGAAKERGGVAPFLWLFPRCGF